MKLFYAIDELSEQCRPSVVSIGNYDGVHLGHQKVIETLLEYSQQLAVPSTIITFDPIAKEFFMPNSVARLMSFEQRAQALFKLGVDQILCINFTAEFAAYSPMAFVQDVLIDGLGVRHLCVGDDFRFGKDRAGDFTFLETVGKENDFAVTAHETFMLDGERVSSGRVRAALQKGDFSTAKTLLGRPYSIDGSISKGQQLGRTLNFPTANIVLGDYALALNGVFAVTAIIGDDEFVYGVANLGKRPTVDGVENRLEVHLFDFDRDVYGNIMSVVFHKKIRDEKKFDSLDALRRQIADDAGVARRYFANKTSFSGF